MTAHYEDLAAIARDDALLDAVVAGDEVTDAAAVLLRDILAAVDAIEPHTGGPRDRRARRRAVWGIAFGATLSIAVTGGLSAAATERLPEPVQHIVIELGQSVPAANAAPPLVVQQDAGVTTDAGPDAAGPSIDAPASDRRPHRYLEFQLPVRLPGESAGQPGARTDAMPWWPDRSRNGAAAGQGQLGASGCSAPVPSAPGSAATPRPEPSPTTSPVSSAVPSPAPRVDPGASPARESWATRFPAGYPAATAPTSAPAPAGYRSPATAPTTSPSRHGHPSSGHGQSFPHSTRWPTAQPHPTPTPPAATAGPTSDPREGGTHR